MRVVKPDYWKSPKLANLTGDWDARHVLSAVWSYVDDNGVGLDNPALIAAECFRFEDQTLATPRVAAALNRLYEAEHIDRYKAEVDGVEMNLLGVCDWKNWQKPDHPSAPRFPQSAAVKGRRLARNSRGAREKFAAGTGVGDRSSEYGDRNAPGSAIAEPVRESGTSPAREDEFRSVADYEKALREQYPNQFTGKP